MRHATKETGQTGHVAGMCRATLLVNAKRLQIAIVSLCPGAALS